MGKIIAIGGGEIGRPNGKGGFYQTETVQIRSTETTSLIPLLRGARRARCFGLCRTKKTLA